MAGQMLYQNPKKPLMPKGNPVVASTLEDALPAQITPTYQPATYTPVYTPPPATSVIPVVAPKIQLPDYTGLAPLPDYTGRIQESADLAIKSGLEQLQSLVFGPQYETERGRLASRGLTGAGVESDILSDLIKGQEAQAGQFASGIQSEAFKAQTQEMQALRQLQFEQNKMKFQQEFDAAIQQGNWEQAADIANQEIKLDYEDLNLRNKEMEVNIAKFNTDENWRQYTSVMENKKIDLESRRVDLEATGVNVDMYLAELEEARMIVNSYAAAGYEGDDLIDGANAGLLAAGLGAYVFTETETSSAGKTQVAGTNFKNEIIGKPIGSVISSVDLIDAGAIEKRSGNQTRLVLENTVWVPGMAGTWKRVS